MSTEGVVDSEFDLGIDDSFEGPETEVETDVSPAEPEAQPTEEGAQPEEVATEAPEEPESQEQEASEDSDESTSEEPEPLPEGETGGYEFAGRAYRDQAHAEQVFRSWEGRLNKANSDANSLRGTNAELEDYAQLAYQENQRLFQELQQLRSGGNVQSTQAEGAEGQANAPTEAPKSTAEQLAEAVDAKTLEQVMAIAQQQGYDPAQVGIAFATKKLTEKFAEVLDQKVDERFADATAPYNEMAAKQQEVSVAQQAFGWAASLQDADGTPVYPELVEGSDVFNAAFIKDAVQVWRNLATTNAEFALSQNGIDYAMRLTRDHYAQNPPAAPATEGNSGEAAPAGTAANMVRDAQGRFLKKNATAAEAAASIHTTGKKPTEPNRDPDAELAKAMRESAPAAVTEDGYDLGFDAV